MVRTLPVPAARRLPGAATRASDAERERATAALRRHFAAGRIDADELEDRVDRALLARDRGELRAAQAGLPSDIPHRAATGFYGVQRRVLGVHAAGCVALNGTALGLWELGGAGFFWPALVLAPTAAALGTHARASRALRRRLGLPRR